MGYLHIENLYRRPEFLTGPDSEVYALEKVHGTSAHIALREGGLHLFPGGEKLENFAALFMLDGLEESMRRAAQTLEVDSLTIFGEAYGGKQQGMRDTYGDKLRFIAFDVLPGCATMNGHRVGWLDTHAAKTWTEFCGLEFVPFDRVPCNLAALNAARDAPSAVSFRKTGRADALREGVVIRPIIERIRPDGQRVIYKHKRDEFRETKAPRQVDLGRVQVLQGAQAIADEWVTDERLSHVLDHMAACQLDVGRIESTGAVVRAVFEDVKREGDGEIAWSKEAERAVGTRAAKLYKTRIGACS